MNIINRADIYFNYTKIGEDQYGNSYYVSKYSKNPDTGDNKRMVAYRGITEPSKVPPKWHAWLHYLVSTEELQNDTKKYNWQKDHMPNLTGTKLAKFPSGHISYGGERDKVSADYDAWNPYLNSRNYG
jgi:NADH:ubiquinone oxidoreductase subunit